MLLKTIHYIHLIYLIYFGFGGLVNFTDKNVYLIAVKFTLFGWLFFGKCIMNIGQPYEKKTFVGYVLKDFNIPVVSFECIINSILYISIFNAMRVTGDYSALFFVVLSYLTFFKCFRKMFYGA